MKKAIIYRIGIVFFIVLGIGLLFYFVFFFHGSRIWRDRLIGNKDHYMACADLPSIARVHQVVSQHAAEMEEFVRQAARRYRPDNEINLVWEKTTSAGTLRDSQDDFYVEVRWGEKVPECYGLRRGDIVVHDPGRGRRLFESMFGDHFFGIPYRIINI